MSNQLRQALYGAIMGFTSTALNMRSKKLSFPTQDIYFSVGGRKQAKLKAKMEVFCFTL